MENIDRILSYIILNKDKQSACKKTGGALLRTASLPK